MSFSLPPLLRIYLDRDLAALLLKAAAQTGSTVARQANHAIRKYYGLPPKIGKGRGGR